jgi:hypothetical protein
VAASLPTLSISHSPPVSIAKTQQSVQASPDQLPSLNRGAPAPHAAALTERHWCPRSQHPAEEIHSRTGTAPADLKRPTGPRALDSPSRTRAQIQGFQRLRKRGAPGSSSGCSYLSRPGTYRFARPCRSVACPESLWRSSAPDPQAAPLAKGRRPSTSGHADCRC